MVCVGACVYLTRGRLLSVVYIHIYSGGLVVRDIVCPCLSGFDTILGNNLVTILILVSKNTWLDRDIYSEGFFKPRPLLAPHREPERTVRGHYAEGLRGPEAGSVGTPLLSVPPSPVVAVPGSPGAAGY